MQRLLFFFSTLLLLGSCARPTVQFMMPETAQAGNAVSFANTTLDATTYLWDFGDGTTSTERDPAHRYLTSGSYTVTLTATNEKGKSTTKKQTVNLAAPKRCLVLIQTPEGEMIAEIFDSTPLHQDNFVKLIEQNFYDSLLFHRVIQGFMIQGGDPDSRGAPAGGMLGSGGPGYTIKAEFQDSLAHVKGALAAARTNNPQKRSSGSQFYIVQGREVNAQTLNQREGRYDFRYPSHVRDRYLEVGGTPFLDQEYTVFGQVIEGLDVIDRIAEVPTNSGNRPDDDMWMIIKLIR
ncbi:MAG: peptidylprolyl isomerase [Bacteroidota bacterium]